ncbi:MAG TPA: hypothetical protein VHX63_02605 [Acidobacteriaceae bacterium]|jgi:hypothetical protein|nr:hypothetical protein [Acidobacteriaceae bacterium]
MTLNRRPLSITILACLYLAVGILGFAFHFRELLSLQPDIGWIELTEFLAIVAGAFMLRGHNWARWLAIAWIAFHVAISFPVLRMVAIHFLFFAVIAWFLFRPTASRYFRGPRNQPT